MSLFGSLNTAISGLGAQSAAFNNISDNVANSQSVGFKRVDTSFTDYLTTSSPTENVAGSVVASPIYVNNIQGNVSQTDNPLSMAITQQGFFAVSESTGSVKGVPAFSPQQYYTRAGDFSMNSTGYLVNSQGQYLNGWSVDQTTGLVNQNALAPIQVSQSSYNPVATSNVDLSANLPATPTPGTGTTTSPLSSNIQVYDSLGTAHTVTLDWAQTPNTANTWNVSIYNGSDSDPTNLLETSTVSFGGQLGGSGASTIAGTVSNITNPTDASGISITDSTPSGGGAALSATAAALGQSASIPFIANFGSGPQKINLNLGTYGGTNGITQYAGNAYNLHGLTQDGVPPGSFSNATVQDDGSIVVNYNNGQSRTIAQVPVITFNDPDALQRQNGQSFTQTIDSGAPTANVANTNGAGGLVTSAVEGSNVNIATEFSQLIVAQQAYSANAKIVTTSDQLLQVTLNMKS